MHFEEIALKALIKKLPEPNTLISVLYFIVAFCTKTMLLSALSFLFPLHRIIILPVFDLFWNRYSLNVMINCARLQETA